MVNSKRKGAKGELEWAHWLQDHGHEARRGQQYTGSTDSPDVVTDMVGFHCEVKRTERLQLYKALEQAKNDAGDKIPYVAHRVSRKPWIVIMYAEDWLTQQTTETNA